MNTLLIQILRRIQRSIIVAVVGLLAIHPAFGQGTLVNNWEGIRNPGDGNPPDPHGAPGPNGVLATVNLRISYYTKAGSLVWGPVALPAVFFPGNTGITNQNSDPAVVFDHGSRRFFVIMQEDHNSRLWINVAVSRNSDPRTSGAADWVTYRVDGTQYAPANSAGGINYGGDYPGLAVDAQALYVTYNMYGFIPDGTMSGAGKDANGSQLTILNKSQLVSGTSVGSSALNLSGQGLKPVTPFGGNPGNVMYLVQFWNQNETTLNVTAVSDPLGAGTVASQFVNVTDLGVCTNQAPQLGSTNTIDPINGRTLGNASLVAGDLWFCATRGQPVGPAVAAYYRLRLNGWPASGTVTVAEQGTVGSSSFWNFCPAIGVNVAGDAVITWTRSSSSSYPTMMVAARNGGDSGFGSPTVIQTSPTGPNNDGRWGDYFSVWPDPNDGSLWAVSEWSRADTGTWSTWWAQIQMAAYDFYVDLNAPFPLIQNGSFGFPYTTVAAGHAAITRGTLHIKVGHYNEQITLNKSVTLTTYGGGPVTIGAP